MRDIQKTAAKETKLSSAAANKEVIGLVATEGIKELVIVFEQTAGKAIVEGDIEQLMRVYGHLATRKTRHQ